MLEIAAAGPIQVGATEQLELSVEWTDGAVTTEIADVFWSSDDPTVLTTSNDGGVEGTATGVSEGTATVEAIFGGHSATLDIEVVDPT